MLAPLAATLLLVQPKLIAHSQANPKDVVGLAGVVRGRVGSSARSAQRTAHRLRAARSRRRRRGGEPRRAHSCSRRWRSFGPLAAGSGAWRRRLAGLLLAGAVATAVALLLWPWLWPAPLSRALFVLHRIREFDVPMRVLYLGQTYRPSELPWHYGWLSLLMATPVPVVLASVAGVVAACRRGPVTRLCRLAASWLALLLLADLLAPARYDGARHLLPALPALALLAAGGVFGIGHALWRRGSAARRAAVALGAVFAASLLALAVELAAIHPYADAYLNRPTRLALGDEAQHRVELEYWGASYKEGAEWLAAHAPRGAFVLVPLGPHAAAPFLAGRFTLVPHDGWRDASRPHYLMLMTREAWYTPRLRRLVADAATAVHRPPPRLDAARHLPRPAARSCRSCGPLEGSWPRRPRRAPSGVSAPW